MAAPVDLPVLPAFVEPPPPPQSILEQPNLEDKEVKAERSIEEETFYDIDPGVFDNELIRQKLYSGVDDDDMEGNITEGTYTGTQAAITHVYRRIERSYESFMDVMQIEPTLPRLIGVEEKKSIYRWSAYPTNADGTTAQYPPHLEVIPEADEVSANDVFGWLHLKETQLLVAKLIPDTFGGKTFNFVQSILADKVGGKPMVGTLRQIEEYNRNHRKSGTDIEAGKNLGLLPDWFSDRRFADQSFTGTNPTTITAVPADLFAEFQSTATRTGETAWADHLSTAPIASFYVQDTRGLRAALGVRPTETLFNREPLSDDSWACAAVTLFELHPSGRLHPVAITIDYQTSMADSITIFNRRLTPTSPSPVSEEEDYPWRYAKTCAQVTDFLRHEVVVHLTQAHFIEEALVVATHRTLPMTHPVFKLLQPHWYKTLSLNAAARATLVPQVIKDLVGIKPEAIFGYIRHEFESFDYVGRYVPNDLAARGFPNTAEGLADERFRDYAYAKNMVPMWEAIRRYVVAVLGVSYADDAAVRGDAAIAAWCAEVQTKGGIRTFPRIQTVAELADAVTMAIHIAAPFHTAVNYLQNFYHAFVPAKPPCLCAPLPTSLDELKAYGERELVRALPVGRQRQWLLAVQVPWLLSNKVASERNLVTFAHSQWRTFRDARDREGRAVREASKGLYGDLRRLDVEFAKTSRGMNEGAVPYNVMDPDSTAVSILI